MFGCIVAGRLVQTNLQQVDVNKFTFQLDDANNINHIVVFLLGTMPFQEGLAATVHLLWPNKTWQLLGMISNTKPSAIFRLKDMASRAKTSGDNMQMDDSMDHSKNGSQGGPVSATLGISIEPIEVVMNQINAKSSASMQQVSNALVPVSNGAEGLAATTTPTIATTTAAGSGVQGVASEGAIAALGQKIITHLYNHITSFAVMGLPPGSTVLTPVGGPGSAGAFLQSGGEQAANNSYLPIKAFNEWYQTLLRKAKADPGFLSRSSLQEERTVPLPRPGELLIYDCRPQRPSTSASASWAAGTVDLVFGEELVAAQPFGSEKASTHPQTKAGDQNDERHKIRCLQWNIERNYKPKEILDTLKAIDADVLCLQEIDIGCHRSGYDRDHFKEICETLQLVGGFVPEFVEIEHSCRKDRDQGGGVHGNAILSKWPISGFRVLDHVHHAYEWEENGHKLNEPRLGRRFTIVAQIETPSGPLLAYSAHLEVFTGIVGRISALSDILADADLHKDQVPHQILFGDLNTISHSIARLAKTISTDQYRVLSLLQQEAEWWDRNLWSWHVDDGMFNLALASGGFNWLRRFGVLGLGTGAAGRHALNMSSSSSSQSLSGREGTHSYWSADVKYTAWLRSLVKDGLDKVRQARQMQLLRERWIMLQHTNGSGRRPSIPTPTSPLLQSLHHYHHYHPHHLQEGEVWSEMEDFESEKSFQDDGSVVLVGRPRMQIRELGSSAIDKEDRDSLASLSPTESFEGQVEDAREEVIYRDSEATTAPTSPIATPGSSASSSKTNSRGKIGIMTHQLDTAVVGSTSVPSTPLKSPTLRLIPPTPKGENQKAMDGVTDDDRGISLDYRDNSEEQQHQQQHQQQFQRKQRQHSLGDDAGFTEGYTYYEDAERQFERQRYYKDRRRHQSVAHEALGGQHPQHGTAVDDDEREMQATRARRAKALARKIYDQDQDGATPSSRPSHRGAPLNQQQQHQHQQHQQASSHDNFNEYHPYHDRHPHDNYDPAAHDSSNDITTTNHSHDQHHDHHEHSLHLRLIDDKISSSSHHNHHHHENDHRDSHDRDPWDEPRPPFSLIDLEEPFLTHHRLWSGFTPLVLHQARNPGFYDPWDSSKDLTLHNPNFLGLLSAKLDYTLLRHLECHARAKGNEDYKASDHQWLVVTVSFEHEFQLDGESSEDGSDKADGSDDEVERTREDERDDEDSDDEDNDDEDDDDYIGEAATRKNRMTQQEREYLWWRQKRMQWKQPVQPVPSSAHHTLKGSRRGPTATAIASPTGTATPSPSSSSSSSSISSWMRCAFLVGAAAAAAAWWLKK
ncbi:hypothetical protein DFQ27_007052 [Actinomortierella ambigua]|uniref:Endonuclease/exonuclease/phosphatase domain-containing protein n=1 Tax=Actinomortierella ambigua TaxID=1343610 RepID=A0A9P6QGW8_9FUNG|nr:hypothetical protein DFQ27_007052 [Actinomortierella ambigua]